MSFFFLTLDLILAVEMTVVGWPSLAASSLAMSGSGGSWDDPGLLGPLPAIEDFREGSKEDREFVMT